MYQYSKYNTGLRSQLLNIEVILVALLMFHLFILQLNDPKFNFLIFLTVPELVAINISESVCKELQSAVLKVSCK